MSWDPLGFELPLFSASYSSRTSSSYGRFGTLPFQIFIAVARVLLAIPLRSIGRKLGSICTTTIEPGGLGLCRETNGWSIQPPANCSRFGIEPSSFWTGEKFITNVLAFL